MFSQMWLGKFMKRSSWNSATTTQYSSGWIDLAFFVIFEDSRIFYLKKMETKCKNTSAYE